MTSSSFRSDIQGLRALAVLSVVIYHISPKHLMGGFIGVDIFFVISGYLIIGQICQKLENNKFSLVDFYVKRFKRLFPAYIAVATITSFFAFVYFLPSEFSAYASSLAYSSFYLSNFYFYSKSGYFDSELQGNPLLHTWSLSVEEQFYAVMPFILILCFTNLKKYKYIGLVSIGFASFFASLILSHTDINFAFFSPFTRFWQFIAGGFAAIYLTRVTLTYVTREAINAISLFTLIACILFMGHDDFPGTKVIIPTLAITLFLGLSKPGSVTYKLTSINIAKFFGNISYSLYLWHWPVIIFYPLILQEEPTQLHKLYILCISVILGIFGYYWVEERFRRGKSKPLNVGLTTAALTLALTLTVWKTQPVHNSLFTTEQKALEGYLFYETPHFRADTCFLTSDSNGIENFDKDVCIQSSDKKENIVLIGDSHAAHWFSSLHEAVSPNQSLSQITASGCKPTRESTGENRCVQLIEWAYDEALFNTKFSKVIISARWLEKDIPNLIRSVELLNSRGLEVIVMGPIIEYFQPLPRILAISDDSLDISKSSNFDKVEKIDAKIHREVTKVGAKYFSTLKAMCSSPTECLSQVDGVPAQFDYGHLTEAGAQKVLEKFKYL